MMQKAIEPTNKTIVSNKTKKGLLKTKKVETKKNFLTGIKNKVKKKISEYKYEIDSARNSYYNALDKIGSMAHPKR